MRILLVEDEEKLAKALKVGLTKKGYAVDTIDDGDKAMRRISLNHMDYDLIILDLMLPGMDGIAITAQMRENSIITPILILTARNEIDIKVNMLLNGADDYMVKPFSFEELCARIQALLRRPNDVVQKAISIANIELDSATHVVRKDGKPVPLTLKEFMLLEYFMRNPYRVVNREELLTHLWDFNYSSFSNVVDVHVKNLRRKLAMGGDPNILETVRGIGYRLRG